MVRRFDQAGTEVFWPKMIVSRACSRVAALLENHDFIELIGNIAFVALRVAFWLSYYGRCIGVYS